MRFLTGILGITLAATMSASLAFGQETMAAKAYEQKVTEAGGRVVFVFGEDRAFEQCHASTVVQAADGALIAAWFGGKEEKNPDVGIWMSRFVDGAWTAPESAAKVRMDAHWNPVLFRDAKDVIYLFFKVGKDVPKWATWWMRSKDNGITWSEAVELVPDDIGGRGPVKNQPIILSDGSWLAPASHEFDGWKSFADRTTDHGATWERSAYWEIDTSNRELRGKGAIQPAFWEHPEGHVHALMRTTKGKVWRADSEDFGQTWSPVYVTDLPNNNSGLDLLRIEDGRIFLVYNPVGENWGPRTPLDLAVSKDNGDTWTNIAHLEDDPDLESEYSYPTITRTKDGVAITYTWNRDKVRCWQIPLAALE